MPFYLFLKDALLHLNLSLNFGISWTCRNIKDKVSIVLINKLIASPKKCKIFCSFSEKKNIYNFDFYPLGTVNPDKLVKTGKPDIPVFIPISDKEVKLHIYIVHHMNI